LTPAAERLATLAGAVASSFDKGAELLQEMAAVHLSESTVERTTEDAGRRLADLFEQEMILGPVVQWNWRRDAQGRTVAYFTIDATGTRQQGPGGTKAEGRMAYVAGIYNPPPVDWLRCPGQRVPELQARYLAGLYSLADMGTLLRRQGASVGMERAQVWIALTDGGNGLEQFAQSNFNRADLVVILDYYHPASYLEKLAKLLHASAEDKAKEQAEAWCRLLKEEGGATTLAVLREWAGSVQLSKAVQEQWEKIQEYFSNNLHRMEYPEYEAEGWCIGSGVVESACKTVVGQRLKGAGMRWGEDGAHTLCHMRALYRSEKGQWDAFWKRQFDNQFAVQQLN
jgi:hypothetical protein